MMVQLARHHPDRQRQEPAHPGNPGDRRVGREWLTCLWYRLRLTIAEMNYATRRMVELQAPWIADDRPAEPAD